MKRVAGLVLVVAAAVGCSGDPAAETVPSATTSVEAESTLTSCSTATYGLTFVTSIGSRDRSVERGPTSRPS